jgi:hypothetical protein
VILEVNSLNVKSLRTVSSSSPGEAKVVLSQSIAVTLNLAVSIEVRGKKHGLARQFQLLLTTLTIKTETTAKSVDSVWLADSFRTGSSQLSTHSASSIFMVSLIGPLSVHG